MQKKTNLQDLLFLRASQELLPITGYDTFVVVLETEGRQQVIYKHAISTMVPAHPADLRETEEDSGS